jgi:hypothetical protein
MELQLRGKVEEKSTSKAERIKILEHLRARFFKEIARR